VQQKTSPALLRIISASSAGDDASMGSKSAAAASDSEKSDPFYLKNFFVASMSDLSLQPALMIYIV
jgi:hypothetical protein